MTPEQLGESLENLVISANTSLEAGVIKVQDYLYNQLVKAVKGLELDDSGNIIQNATNRKVIQDTLTALDTKIQTSGYQQYVEAYLKTLPKMDALNNKYFSALSDSFKPNRQFISSLQKNTVSQIEDLLFNSGFEAQIRVPLQGILNANINSGAKFTDALDQVRQYVKGSTEIDGKLLKYTRTVTRDTLFDYSRAFQKALTEDLGLEWFCYSGGLMDKSRPFCIEHAGHYYPKTEVESWAVEDWQGKRPDTNESTIFIFAGGWNCTHSIIPVAKIAVPDEEIQAAKDRGFEN